MADHVVLVGLMGTGKTTVGRIVAERLGLPFVDSDEQIEAAVGKTVRQIFETDGEEAFRRFEAEALAAALDGEPAVVAAAGGVVLAQANRDLLRRQGVVVWLTGDPDELAARATTGTHRPLLADDPAGVLRRMTAERRPLYEEVADHQVDVTELPPEQVAERIMELVG